MSKDAKKKVARVESFKDSEIVRMNELIGQLNRDVCRVQQACESAAAAAAGLLTRSEAAEAECVRLNGELTASQDCVTKYLAELDAIKSVLAAAEVVGAVTSAVEALHQIQEPGAGA